MLDKLSKATLIYMNNRFRYPRPSTKYYDFGKNLCEMANHLSVDVETMRTTIRYLEEHKYIKYVCNSDGNPLRFYLDHQGLHWMEFRRKEIIRYLEDKWIDCLAMLLSLAALILSIMNMYGGSPTGN